MLEIQHLDKIFQSGFEEVVVFDDLNLKIEKGEIVALKGTSGSGKTTLLNMIGTFDQPTDGKILLENQSILKFTSKEIVSFRKNNLSMIWQSNNLIPSLTAEENIRIASFTSKKEEIASLAEDLGVLDKLLRFPGELSRGERQRIATVRGLIKKPQILLADEPTASLDRQNSDNVIDLLLHHAKKYAEITIIATHDNKIAEKCDRIIDLSVENNIEVGI